MGPGLYKFHVGPCKSECVFIKYEFPELHMTVLGPGSTVQSVAGIPSGDTRSGYTIGGV